MEHRLKILLVDDDEDEFALTRALLADRSYLADGNLPVRFQLEWVATYPAALEAFQKNQFDVYLVDYRLGERDGLDLLRAAKACGCTAPVILLTGKGSYAIDVEAMQVGAHDYLVKGELTAPLLERTIRYAMERKRAEDSLLKSHEELELRVRERTLDLARTNQELREEIAERQRVEAALQAERQRLFSLLDELPAFVYLQAPDYSIRFANCHFQEQFGQPQGRCCYDVIRKQQEPCAECPTFQVFKTKAPVEWEWRLADGRSFQVYDYPFTDVDGAPLVLELGIDITRRKQVEAQLEANNRALLELSLAERNQRQFSDGLVQATAALNSSLNLDEVLDRILEQIQRVIPCQAAAILLVDGQRVQVARHRGFEGLIPKWDLLDLTFALEAIPFLKTMSVSCEPLLVPDPHTAPLGFSVPGFEWVRSYAAAPLQSDAQLVGFLNVLSDRPGFFSEETVVRLSAFAAHAVAAIQNARLYKELQSALEQEQAVRARLVQAEKLAGMGRMVASVAHELNNPLQTIKNCLYLIQQELQPEDALHDYLEMAFSETQRLSQLVTQLRELHRPHNLLPMQPIALLDILAEVRLLLEPQLKGAGVGWQQPARPRNSLVCGVPDQLKQVFLNISTNAIEAMQPGGGTLAIRLVWNAAAGEVGVIFQDSGPGISKENQAKIFEPFITTKPVGLGLGLPICNEIIERHSGRISVDSQPGRGTAFTVWLPVVGG